MRCLSSNKSCLFIVISNCILCLNSNISAQSKLIDTFHLKNKDPHCITFQYRHAEGYKILILYSDSTFDYETSSRSLFLYSAGSFKSVKNKLFLKTEEENIFIYFKRKKRRRKLSAYRRIDVSDHIFRRVDSVTLIEMIPRPSCRS